MKALPICIPLALVAMTSTQADTLTIPNTFTAGTPAVADEVNANFNAAKTAVDDNDARISTMETSKQNRVNGACATGYSIRAINADGSVVCELDNDSGGSSGHIAVSFSALRPHTNINCQTFIRLGYYYYTTDTTNTSCHSYAPLQLPHGAYIDSLTCNLYDNATGSNVAYLSRVSNTSYYTIQILETSFTTDVADTVQTLTDDTPIGASQVDNTSYTYMLEWTTTHDTSTVGANARFYSCIIAYHY